MSLLTKCPKCGAIADERTIKDKTFKGFWHGADLHQETYEFVNNHLGREVLKSRADGKTCNFALIFGANEWKMNSEYPQYSKPVWKQIIEAFFVKYKDTKEHHRRMERLMTSVGWVNDIFGRKRRVSKEEIGETYKHALNMFINAPVQSSEVGYAELCLNRTRKWLIDEDIYSDGDISNGLVSLVHFNHDELIAECPNELVPIVAPKMLEIMRYAVQLKVPVDAEQKIKECWS